MDVLLLKMLIRQIQAGNIRVEDIKNEMYKNTVIDRLGMSS